MGRGLRGQVINLFLNVRVCGDTELLVKFIISILILAPTRELDPSTVINCLIQSSHLPLHCCRYRH